MISVVIPALNEETRLSACLGALSGAAADGLIKEIIVVDGGSADGTVKIADGFGARVLTAPPGRGGQLRAGAEAAKGAWLLFLHGDTVLAEGWEKEVIRFIEQNKCDAGIFTLAFDAKGLLPRLVAFGAMQRTRWARAPYGDQGLLISKSSYDEIGGFADIPLFEDVDIVRRLIGRKGRFALHIFSSKAVTSAERYEREGYIRRVIANFILLTRYQLGAAPEDLAKAYR